MIFICGCAFYFFLCLNWKQQLKVRIKYLFLFRKTKYWRLHIWCLVSYPMVLIQLFVIFSSRSVERQESSYYWSISRYRRTDGLSLCKDGSQCNCNSEERTKITRGITCSFRFWLYKSCDLLFWLASPKAKADLMIARLHLFEIHLVKNCCLSFPEYCRREMFYI